MWPFSSTPRYVPSNVSACDTLNRTVRPMWTSEALTRSRNAAKPSTKNLRKLAANFSASLLRNASTSNVVSSRSPAKARKDVAGHTGRSIVSSTTCGVFMLTPMPTMIASRRGPGDGSARARMPPSFIPLATMSFGHLMPNETSSRSNTVSRKTSTALTATTCVTLGAFRFTKALSHSWGKRKKNVIKALMPRSACHVRSLVPRPAVWKSALTTVSLDWSKDLCSRST
mmetsp:Transcript_13469/g.36292  ORF Transcript_13469/g.36292 Transcript_13469/m.36292 type:complete len:228 (+) Transcript_13469:265-948(+)